MNLLSVTFGFLIPKNFFVKLTSLSGSTVVKEIVDSKKFFRGYNFLIKSIARSSIIFEKPRKMTNDFFNNYIFVHTFQWTSSL